VVASRRIALPTDGRHPEAAGPFEPTKDLDGVGAMMRLIADDA
jgi:hypothetical protein